MAVDTVCVRSKGGVLLMCSNGVSWRTLSSGARHGNPGRVLSRLHASASDCIQASRWVLVPSRCHLAQPHLPIYRNVCTNLSHETVSLSCFTRYMCCRTVVLITLFIVIRKILCPCPVRCLFHESSGVGVSVEMRKVTIVWLAEYFKLIVGWLWLTAHSLLLCFDTYIFLIRLVVCMF